MGKENCKKNCISDFTFFSFCISHYSKHFIRWWSNNLANIGTVGKQAFEMPKPTVQPKHHGNVKVKVDNTCHHVRHSLHDFTRP